MSDKSNNAKGSFGRPRSTMMLSELDALAGDPVSDAEDAPVIVRYTPQTPEEAEELLNSLILVSDMTGGANREPMWYAGFSKDDLLDGRPGVHVTMGKK
jgi:hypothetical protein